MQFPGLFPRHSWLTAMLVACLPLLVALLVGLPSTVTAQTPDHQRQDISGVLGTNAATSDDFGDEHLSKHPTFFVRDPPKEDEFRSPKLDNSKNILHFNFESRDESEAFRLNSGVAGRDQRSASNSGVAGTDQTSASIPKNSSHVTSGVFPCPDDTDIAPCVCTFTNATDLTMDCSAVESIEQLATIFTQNFPVKEFYMFMINNNDKIQLLPDVFNGVSFRYLELYKVPNLAQITNYALADSRDTLENIHIYNSLLTEDTFPFSTLDQYTKLSYLYIYYCNIYFLPAFKSPSLQTLTIVYGHISELPAGKIYGRPFSNLQINDSKYYYSNLIWMLIFTERLTKSVLINAFFNFKIFLICFLKCFQLLIVVDMFNLILYFKCIKVKVICILFIYTICVNSMWPILTDFVS